MVDPSPPRDTTVTIADGGTPPLDDTTYDLQLRIDTHPENQMLTHIINEPGPNNNNNNNNTRVITLAERFNSVNYISCEMHLTSSGSLRSTGIEYMICRVNACKRQMSI